jgi:hypothetical protein
MEHIPPCYNSAEENALSRNTLPRKENMISVATYDLPFFLVLKMYFEKIENCLLFHVFLQTTGSVSFKLDMRDLY